MIVGVMAPWVGRGLDTPQGKRRATTSIFWVWLIWLLPWIGGDHESRARSRFSHKPDLELAARFPLAMVPTFLVPPAFMNQMVSLWQLVRGRGRYTDLGE